MFPLRDTDASKVNDAQREIAKLREQVKLLERRAEKQAAFIRAISSILFEKLGVIEPELLAAIARIENQRAEQPERACTHCKRTMKPGSKKCLYCGAEVPITSVFDLI
ncbi:MAG: hypothetical protein U0798_13330 [Gemmataceae bacterium]